MASALLAVTVVFSVATARAAAPGSLDSTFGSAGVVTTPIGASGWANSVALEPDGKILAVGLAAHRSGGFLSNLDFALARYRQDGSLDVGFGAGGTVTTDLSGGDDVANAAVVQSDGKVVVAGSGSGAVGLARYMPDGSLDPSFGSGGIVTTFVGRSSDARAVALQPDGRIVVAGSVWKGETDPDGGQVHDFALARYLADGTLDPSFGKAGVVTTDFTLGNNQAYAVVVQPDGKILAAGASQTPIQFPGGNDFAVARYEPDGALDPSFGKAGKVRTSFAPSGYSATATSMALQPNGAIVVGGATEKNFALARYRPDGSLDSNFGASGRVTTSFGAERSFSKAVLVGTDGKIIAVGEDDLSLTHSVFAVARYMPTGSLDKYFGTRGEVTTAIGPSSASATAGALQPDGRIIAAGGESSGSRGNFALVRYTGGTLHCRVPKVTGKTVVGAKQAIRRARCVVGRVKRRFSKATPRGHVIAQRPRAGKRLPAGMRVKLVVSRGRHH